MDLKRENRLSSNETSNLKRHLQESLDMSPSEENEPGSLESKIRILEHKQLMWETSRFKRGLTIVSALVAIIGGVGGLAFGLIKGREKDEAVVERNEIEQQKKKQEVKLTDELEESTDILQEKVGKLQRENTNLEKRQVSWPSGFFPMGPPNPSNWVQTNLNPAGVPFTDPIEWNIPNQTDETVSRKEYEALLKQYEEQVKKHAEADPDSQATQKPGDNDPKAEEQQDPSLLKLAAQLFDESGSTRVKAYDAITSKPLRYEAALPILIIQEAHKHPEHARGVRNVIVSLRDMSRTATQKNPANKAAIEKFIKDMDQRYADKPAIIKALRSMEEWIVKP